MEFGIQLNVRRKRKMKILKALKNLWIKLKFAKIVIFVYQRTNLLKLEEHLVLIPNIRGIMELMESKKVHGIVFVTIV